MGTGEVNGRNEILSKLGLDMRNDISKFLPDSNQFTLFIKNEFPSLKHLYTTEYVPIFLTGN
jgi:hypothetical protein